MLLEKIKTPGLSHLSYLIGSGGKAAVIDPRRDCEIYLEKARAQGLEITHIFETHRNEDLITGSPILAQMTGATVLHGPNPAGEVAFAKTAKEGDTFEIGQLTIEVVETPGHTDDHLAFVIHDREYTDGPVGVFTGDALFVGDVGRTDFYPDRKREVAGLLYDSLQKLLALGDQAIIYPAHGAGSVCGSGMAEREFSTIGHERRNNPRLQLGGRDAFIEAKVAEHHYQPPYFRLMERLNLEGAQPGPRVVRPKRLTLPEMRNTEADHVIDVREPLSFASGHFPGSMCLPVGMISAFAGWFIREGETIVLVGSDEDQLSSALSHLTRIGLDNVIGGYNGVVPAAANGVTMNSLPMVDTDTVKSRLDQAESDWTLLDVRDADERAASAIEGSEHIYVGELNERWSQLNKDRSYTLMCASGMRATVLQAGSRAAGSAISISISDRWAHGRQLMADAIDAQQFWDERFAGDDYVFGTQPNAFLVREAHRLEPGSRVLAVADGEGRNSVFLAKHGHKVVATDISERALEKADRLAAKSGVEIQFVQADLATWAWPENGFDAVVAIFIQFAAPQMRERIFKKIAKALRPGGLLLLEGYRPEQVAFGTGGPPSAENMYTGAMLREAFGALNIELLESYDAEISEGKGHVGRSALIDLVARRPK